MQIDRTDNKGYIATHQLRDRDGNAPIDGQRSQKVYGLKDHEELAKHVLKHMGPPEPPEPGESPQEEAAESPQMEAAEGE